MSESRAWIDDIERATLDNETFRTVLFTGERLQLTVMRLAPGEDIGAEVHPDPDQFVRVVHRTKGGAEAAEHH